MRFFLAAAAATALTAGIANAQYKTPAPAPQPPPGTVQLTPNTPQATTTAPDELSTARRVKREEAMRLVRAEKAVYIDVRSKDSYDEGHLPGALSFPLSEIPTRLKELPLKKFLITYCA